MIFPKSIWFAWEQNHVRLRRFHFFQRHTQVTSITSGDSGVIRRIRFSFAQISSKRILPFAVTEHVGSPTHAQQIMDKRISVEGHQRIEPYRSEYTTRFLPAF